MILIRFSKKFIYIISCLLLLSFLNIYPLECKKGYYLVQSVCTYNQSKYGFISDIIKAEKIFKILVKSKVSGIEFETAWYDSNDINVHKNIAELAQKYDIDLWLTTWNYQAKIKAFNKNTFPENFRAYSMTAKGEIIPAIAWSNGSPEGTFAFDILNPLAMDWFIEIYKKKYLDPMKNFTNGFIFNEDKLMYTNNYIKQNNYCPEYWNLPVYSDSVLDLWKKYCIERKIKYNNQIVDKFPVHKKEMVKFGNDKTRYFPGNNLPEKIKTGTLLIDIPKNTGVWIAWYDFITSLFVESYINRISKAVKEVNKNNPNFKGIIYFGLHWWSIGIEEIKNKTFKVDIIHKWIPWGTQLGINLTKITKSPYVDYIICETYPPLKANIINFLLEYKRIIENNGKRFGLMLHRDDNWEIGKMDLESYRWNVINELSPIIICRYPLERLFPDDKYYNKTMENEFINYLINFRE